MPIRRSERADDIVCLICGKHQKILKHHLVSRHDLDAGAYREMFGLKNDYPLVAPAYAAARSALAKQIGLGRTSTPAKAPRKRTPRKPAAEMG